MSILQVVDNYNFLLERVYKYMRDKPDVLGSYKWLQYSISEGDIRMYTSGYSLVCWGYTYTTQTMDHEYFEFEIPITDLEG